MRDRSGPSKTTPAGSCPQASRTRQDTRNGLRQEELNKYPQGFHPGRCRRLVDGGIGCAALGGTRRQYFRSPRCCRGVRLSTNRQPEGTRSSSSSSSSSSKQYSAQQSYLEPVEQTDRNSPVLGEVLVSHAAGRSRRHHQHRPILHLQKKMKAKPDKSSKTEAGKSDKTAITTKKIQTLEGLICTSIGSNLGGFGGLELFGTGFFF